MNRSPIKNLVYTFFHWFLVVALSAISFFVQYAFMTDTGESYSGFFFAGSMRILINSTFTDSSSSSE